MLKIFKTKRFWIITVIVVAVLGFVAFKVLTQKPAVEYTTEKAKRGNLTQTVSATGIVESANEISLNFRATGKIASLPVKEGTVVKAGQVLANLELGSVGALIKQYEANLASAKANLEKVKAGASTEDINLTQEQYDKSLNDYNSLVKESESQVKILKEKMIDSLNNAVFTSQAALNTVYNDLINNETTSQLLTADSNLQNKVENDYNMVKGDFAALRAKIEEAKNSNYDQAKIVAAADVARDFLSKLNTFLDNSYALSDKIIINTTYTQAAKDAIKADISTEQITNNSSLTAVQTARANLINSVNSYQTQIEAASNTVSISQATLNLKKVGPRSFDVSAAEAQVAQAQASLDKARADYEDYVIKAPIDGKVTKVNYSVGESPSTAAIIQMLGNERYEIKVDIPESDITKIKVADKTVIELDAFGSDHPFLGAVTFIDPAQTIIKDVTYYKTTVSFNEDSWSDQIKPGMTANITIMSEEKSNVLYIPQRAVKIKETTLGEVPTKYVEVLVNGQPQERIVTIGLRGDNGLVEITSGLTESDDVITFQKANK
jgi:RND family efflux transporter MFP subunit